jgi:hypothetical protein
MRASTDTGDRPSLHAVLAYCRCQTGEDLVSPTNPWGTHVKWNFVQREIAVFRKREQRKELRSSATARNLLLLSLHRPLIRRGTCRRLAHVRLKVELGSSETVQPLLLLLFLCRKGKRCSRATFRLFLQLPTRGMLLQSMERIHSPALHHRTFPPATLCDVGAAYPALQHSASMLMKGACGPFAGDTPRIDAKRQIGS